MNLQTIRDALLTVGAPVSHYQARAKTDQYIVWAEDGQGETLWADGYQAGQVIQGTIDYFSRSEYDPNMEKIQTALSEAGISFRLNSIQFEEDTKYIHYEWVWEVV